MSIAKDAFHIELSLARMAVGMANRHRADLGCDGLVHQVRRLESHYRKAGDNDRADKLARILTWFDAGGPEPAEVIVLSETRNAR